MCRYLIQVKQGTNFHLFTNQPPGFQANEVVYIAEDGHVWGGKEQPPDYLHFDEPGVPAADRAYLLGQSLKKPISRIPPDYYSLGDLELISDLVDSYSDQYKFGFKMRPSGNPFRREMAKMRRYEFDSNTSGFVDTEITAGF